MSTRPETLAEYLGVDTRGDVSPNIIDIEDAKAFGQAVLNSPEFRRYILIGLTLGNLPGFTSVLLFLLQHAVGKPPDKLEVSGAVEHTVTEVRRVVVKAPQQIEETSTVH